MREERVEFYSEGVRLVGRLRSPDAPSGPIPAIVQGPGWLGLAGAKTYKDWHEPLVRAGYAVLVFDYRGWGESDGERGWIRPDDQVQDITNAVTYLSTRDEIDAGRIGAYGTGGLGAGCAIVATAIDRRIRCCAAQSIVADGELWLRRMRREYEWSDYLRALADDARSYVAQGTSRLVDPRVEIMVSTPERAGYTGKKDVDARMQREFHMQSARAIMRFRPIDIVHRISPRALLLICVEGDAVTPEEHALLLYERAGEPKRLVRQLGTSHYESYTRNFDLLSSEIVSWYDAHLAPCDVEVRDRSSQSTALAR